MSHIKNYNNWKRIFENMRDASNYVISNTINILHDGDSLFNKVFYDLHALILKDKRSGTFDLKDIKSTPPEEMKKIGYV